MIVMINRLVKFSFVANHPCHSALVLVKKKRLVQTKAKKNNNKQTTNYVAQI